MPSFDGILSRSAVGLGTTLCATDFRRPHVVACVKVFGDLSSAAAFAFRCRRRLGIGHRPPLVERLSAVVGVDACARGLGVRQLFQCACKGRGDVLEASASPRRERSGSHPRRSSCPGLWDCPCGVSPPAILLLIKCVDRDRGTPRDATPPTPPGIRVRTTAVRPS